MQTFANLPLSITDAISTILSRSDTRELSAGASRLHERYMNREKGGHEDYIQSPSDMMAYLGLRAPATYAQIYGALLQIQERVPHWQPKTILDVGCGPGTGIWAAKTLWPTITHAQCIDQEQYFLSLGQEILQHSHLDITAEWKKNTLEDWVETRPDEKFDLIIAANVWNELPEILTVRLLSQFNLRTSGIVLILEPGSSVGYPIIQNLAEKISKNNTIIAPYIHNSFVRSDEYWIHFPQKFQRPEFQRRIRQSMRNSNLMASDWEEAKYSYVAFGSIAQEKTIWGQCIGPITKQKGFLIIPLLTEEGVVKTRVLKRYKPEYNFAKNLKWGEVIQERILNP